MRTSLSLSAAEHVLPIDAPLLFLRSFGDYELIDEIARGGMGVVYRARQRSLNRVVALKMLLAGEFASAEFVRRFQSEAQSAASLRHPNIVSIYEIGNKEGQHFFSMELIEGRNLAELTRDGPLPAARAAKYLRAIAEAVEYAHLNGVLHRDLKPSNILIDPFDQPRITDFGVALQLSGNLDLTRTGQALGSPAYMAPEQANGRRVAKASADIYSLGALLYHLIAGRPPFQSDSLLETLRQMKEDEPVPPRQLNPTIAEDLETICLKCLEKDPDRRYRSAGELAAELSRFLQNEPIEARPPTRWRKIRFWSRRHPALAALCSSGAILLLVITVGATAAAWRIGAARGAETRAREAAQAANAELRSANTRLADAVNLLELQRAEDLFRVNDSSAAVAHLAALVRRNPSNHIAAARLLSALVHRNWALPTLTIRHDGRATLARFSPDGGKVLSASWDKTARLHAADSGELLVTVRHQGAVVQAEFNKTGDRFVTASDDGTAGVWNSEDGTPVTKLLRHAGKVHWAEFNTRGDRVVTASADGTAGVWDSSSGVMTAKHRCGSAVLVARFSPDGGKIASGCEDGTVRIWEVSSGQLACLIEAHRGRIHSLEFSADGARLASASEDRTARVWSAGDGREVCAPLQHNDRVYQAVFNPQGTQLLTTSFAGAAQLWDGETGFPLGKPFEHEAGVTFAAFSSDGKLAVTTGLDHTARVWDLAQGSAWCQPFRQFERMVHASFDPAGARLVTASFDGFIQVWDIRPRRAVPLEMRHEGQISSVALQPGGNLVLSSSMDKTARLWNGETGVPAGDPIPNESAVLAASFNANGRSFVTGTQQGVAAVFDTQTLRRLSNPLVHHGAIHSVEFSPGSDRILTASADRTARIWDLKTSQPVGSPMAHDGAVLAARFSSDGHLIATASEDHTARLWNADTGEPMSPPLRHIDEVTSVDFSSDCSLLVTASGDNHAGVWRTAGGALAGTPLRHGRSVLKALFFPGSHRVATVSLDLTARVWDATGEALAEPMKHGSPATQLSVSADGTRLLSGGWNGLVRVWDARTARPLTEWLETHGAVISSVLDPDGNKLVTGADNFVRIWTVPPASEPVPEWFATFAESIAGMKLSERGNLELTSRAELQKFKKNSTGSDIYSRTARWMIEAPAERPAVPW